LEIVSGIGNYSILENEIFLHSHISLIDEGGQTFGGHLESGTIVYSCEYFIQELLGNTLLRTLDEETGLYLWE